MLTELFKVLSGRFPLINEKETQAAIELKLKEAGIQFDREHRLDFKNIPDFFIESEGIAIEIKIKGRAKFILQQCARYSEFDSVKTIILATNRSMGFPKELNDKPCYVINLGRAWL